MKIIDIVIIAMVLGSAVLILFHNHKQNKKYKLASATSCSGRCAGCRGCSK